MRAVTAHFITWYHQILLGVVLLCGVQRQRWGQVVGLRVLRHHPAPPAGAPARQAVASPAPPEAPQPAPSSEIEQVLERIGARHLADLRELCDAFEQVYAAELASKDEQIAALHRQAAAGAREREALAARVQDLERANARQVAELRALSAAVDQQLAATAGVLDYALAAPVEEQEGENQGELATAVPTSRGRRRRPAAAGAARTAPRPRRSHTSTEGPQPTPAPAEEEAAIASLLEGLGAHYVADLRGLRDAFARVYAAELASKDEQIAALRRQAETGAREREALAARARDLEQASGRHAAELRALSAAVDRQLATAAASLGALSAVPPGAWPAIPAQAA